MHRNSADPWDELGAALAGLFAVCMTVAVLIGTATLRYVIGVVRAFWPAPLLVAWLVIAGGGTAVVATLLVLVPAARPLFAAALVVWLLGNLVVLAILDQVMQHLVTSAPPDSPLDLPNFWGGPHDR